MLPESSYVVRLFRGPGRPFVWSPAPGIGRTVSGRRTTSRRS